MAWKDTLGTMKSDAQEGVEKAQQKVTDIESVESELDGIMSGHETALKAAKEEGFEEGLKQAGQAGGSDKIYSDAEMNAEREAVAASTAEPLNAQIESLTKELEESKAKVSDLEAAGQKSEAELNEAVEAARSELKAEFVQGIKAADVDNQALLKKYEESPKVSEPSQGE